MATRDYTDEGAEITPRPRTLTFIGRSRTQRAVVMSLMIVGEAASRILSDHPDFANAKTAIPWRGIRGMRNRIAHGYFDIDLHVVWTTVQTELPALIKHLSQP